MEISELEAMKWLDPIRSYFQRFFVRFGDDVSSWSYDEKVRRSWTSDIMARVSRLPKDAGGRPGQWIWTVWEPMHQGTGRAAYAGEAKAPTEARKAAIAALLKLDCLTDSERKAVEAVQREIGFPKGEGEVKKRGPKPTGNALSAAQRVADYERRKRDAGLVKMSGWVPSHDKEQLKTLIALSLAWSRIQSKKDEELKNEELAIRSASLAIYALTQSAIGNPLDGVNDSPSRMFIHAINKFDNLTAHERMRLLKLMS